MNRLDNTDLTILRILQGNAKKTAKEIAMYLNLTISPVYERIKRLEKLGYIKKYVVLLDKSMLNLPVTAICQVSMRYHEESFIDNFERQIQDLKEVQECLHMAGKVDFILKINVESLDAYHDFVRYKLSKIENIGELNSSFVLKEIKDTTEFQISNSIAQKV
ncbi:Lrp/AsnC family transcriptional regulator [Flagellimonas sp.]|uniref:Lrp/AsnC family transcriptional regulator n=1 Tax=Flagellimonas sp. TaxID=2058762 RepID=UPI003B51EB9B